MKSSIRVVALSLLFILVSTLAGIAQSSGTWTPTGSMSVGRYAMSAVLLPSGKVLVAGGASNGTILATAEVYDPTTGQWSPTGSMTTARRNYVAVVLSNGKVLVAGGCTNLDCSGATNTAEIYDPNGGTWTPTGAMSTLRYFFAATLLSSGQVLVEGGCSAINCYYDTASAEVYNPTTGKWSLIGNMSSSRDYHTATRMGDGRVLVVGGYTGGTITEIYNGHSMMQPWSKAAPALYAQKLHTATLLPNGKVLVAGGIIGYLPGALCELYDPATNSWSATGSMITARALQGAVLLPNGKAMVAGGEAFRRPKYYKLASVELYDPSTGVWSATGNMTIERYQHAIVLLNNGRVLVVGGLSNPDVSLTSAELYTP